MKNKRIILSAGGTGGHLFPAQSIGKQLLAHADVLFVGGGLNNSPYFDREHFKYQEIRTSPFSINPAHKVLKKGSLIIQGLLESRKIISTFKPDLVIGFGSFFTFPLLGAAALAGVPIVLHEQNAIPGVVNRLFSRFAKVNAISFPDAASWLKGQVVEVDFPLRWPLMRKREEACSYFNLSPEKKTILVFGGSQGAVKLNTLFLSCLGKLPKNLQILHFTGNKMVKSEVETAYQKSGLSYCVKEFESRMDLALSLADFVISRAGASTIAELIEWELPAILVPYPFATHHHQDKNAAHFVSKVRGGVMFLEDELTEDLLRGTIEKFLSGDDESYKQNIRSYKKNRHVKEFSELILSL